MFGRPERRLSVGTYSQTPQEVLQVHLAGCDIRIQMSTIWPLQCPKNLHKAAPTGDGCSEISRNENSHLFGRHTYAGGEQGRGHLQLAACRVSGDNMKRQVSLNRLQSSFSWDGAKGPTQPTNLVGQGGPAGVVNGKSIPFHVASSHFLTSCQTYSRKD